ncbi:MAG: NADH:ubiquinone oxidoreductase [Roseinatronobacter sp.]
MAQSEMKNAPPLYGWAIATAAGAVAFLISLIVVGIDGNGSVLIGAVVALVVGIVFTIAETPAKPPLDASVTRAPSPTVAAPEITPAIKQDTVPAAAAAAPAVAESVAAPAASADAEPVQIEGTKPEMLSAPAGDADDLKQITGVGPVLEGKLNEMGVFHFWQIAGWSDSEVVWVDGFLNFKGRIERDDWIGQAKKLAEARPA